MQLTDTEKEMLDGKAGEAVRIAMSILSDIGDAVEAQEMVEIVHVHNEGFRLLKTGQHAVVEGSKGEIFLAGSTF